MNLKLQPGDKIALVGNSNPQKNDEEVKALVKLLAEMDLEVAVSPYIYQDSANRLTSKARQLHHYFSDDKVKAIFDISGGDRSNSLLPLLDYQLIKSNPKPFFGYSDLTTILNSLFQQSQLETELFQLKTLLWDQSGRQKEKFYQTFFEGKPTLYQTDWHFVCGTEMEGQVVGGNLRCFLKLSGTDYLPDLSNKLLFLESRDGGENALFSMFHQVKQQQNFSKLNGILLGTFTEFQQQTDLPITDLLQEVLQQDIPIAYTTQIGHGIDANGLTIGRHLSLNKHR